MRARSDLQNCPEPCRLEHPELLGESALLTGTIPAAWGALSSLVTLGISGNALIGTLPPWFTTLPNLTVVGVVRLRVAAHSPSRLRC